MRFADQPLPTPHPGAQSAPTLASGRLRAIPSLMLPSRPLITLWATPHGLIDCPPSLMPVPLTPACLMAVSLSKKKILKRPG